MTSSSSSRRLPSALRWPRLLTNLGTGEVRQVKEPTTGGKALVVSLLVPKTNADAVAAAGADGRISLVVVGSR